MTKEEFFAAPIGSPPAIKEIWTERREPDGTYTHVLTQIVTSPDNKPILMGLFSHGIQASTPHGRKSLHPKDGQWEVTHNGERVFLGGKDDAIREFGLIQIAAG